MSLSNEQRRNHVRLDESLPGTLTWRAHSVPTTVVDVSEGGARLRLSGASSPALRERITVAFDLDGTPVSLAAEVVRSRSVGVRWSEAAVRFVDVPMATADRIRRHVFAEQLKLRAANRH